MRSNLRSIRLVVFGVVIICLFGSAALGQPWLGSGTAEDPYQIWTAADMQAIGGSAYLGAHFKLMADIDLSVYTGTSFNIIGTAGIPFTGVFDGNGYTISNFTYTSAGRNYTGVFGYVGGGADIKDLGLIDPNVDAGTGDRVGSLVGRIEIGSITNCYAQGGSVAGDDYVGGLVGQGGNITNCYSTASVSGDSRVGGLVGQGGNITNCYSTGSVSGTSSYIGGLVGTGGTVCASFWDIQTSGQTTSAGGKGKTTAQMQTLSTFIGWGGCGNEGVWTIDEGNDYPRLWWENQPGQIISAQLSDFVAGAGTEVEPYLIYTAEQLNLIGLFWCEWDAHFKLMADIDLSAYTGTSFNIIGNDAAKFTGVFDGNGHTISNFTYTSTGRNYIGLFGYVDGPNVEIRDLGLIDPNVDAGTVEYTHDVGSLVGYLNEGDVTGCYVEGGSVSVKYSRIGGLVGTNISTITNCYSTASVSGYGRVGGLVGSNSGGIITNSYTTASVSGTAGPVGGLVGINESYGKVTNCYSEGDVSGLWGVGGLVGFLSTGEISNCDSAGSVSGESEVGGLLGMNKHVTITNCSYRGSVSGTREVGGLVGENEGTIRDCYSSGSVSGTNDRIGGLVGLNSASGTVITGSYSTASVSGNNWVGGLLGKESSGTIYNCYAWGSVSGTGSYIGGLAGTGGAIYDCYSTGSVSGAGSVGGLVGIGGLVFFSFWDIQTSGQTTSAGGIGLPTAQMQMESSFTSVGWDFVYVWDICEGTNYPKLAWQVPVLGDFGCPDGVDESDLGVLCGEWLFELIPADVGPDGGDGIVNFFDWAIFADGWQITIDFDDLAEFADQWLKTGSNYLIADIAPPADGDGIVNFRDFATLANNWLAGL